MKFFYFLSFCLFLYGCKQAENTAPTDSIEIPPVDQAAIMILGNLQDAGAPQLGCEKSCCAQKITNPNPLDAVVSLGLIDPKSQTNYLFEATPDISKQLAWLQKANAGSPATPEGIFLTHAHMGHYAGLLNLGKEAASTKNVPLYTMPRMQDFLKTNAPWSALIENNNVQLKALDSAAVVLTSELRVSALQVPHRDEYSETVGYFIEGPNKSALFIPDIDKWHLWEQSIVDWIKRVDYAFLDATFFSGDELGGRDMSQIPHPSVQESIALFDALDQATRAKVYFIHFNHTNPLLQKESEAFKTVNNKGYNIAEPLAVFPL